MGQPKPREVREAIVRAREQNLGYDEIAELLGVGRATVSRTLRLHRESGDIDPRPKGVGNFSICRGPRAELLRASGEAMPGGSSRELSRACGKEAKVSTSAMSWGRGLR